MKKNVFIICVLCLILTGCGQKEVSKTYTVPAVKEKVEKTEEFTTKKGGMYSVGQPFETSGKEEEFTTKKGGMYSVGQPFETTGDEKEFTSGSSGTYTAGNDFEPGLYNVKAVSGDGNVMGSVMNQMMAATADESYISEYDNVTFADGDTLETSGVSVTLTPADPDENIIQPGLYNIKAVSGDGNVMGSVMNQMMAATADENYISEYDNATFSKGDTLETSGVSVTLTPADPDENIIQPGKYDIKAISGDGNVMGSVVNEMMAATADEFYVTEYDNASFSIGDTLETSGVSVKLIPQEDEVVVTEAQDAYDVTESITDDGEYYYCYINEEQANCDDLKYFDELTSEFK